MKKSTSALLILFFSAGLSVTRGQETDPVPVLSASLSLAQNVAKGDILGSVESSANFIAVSADALNPGQSSELLSSVSESASRVSEAVSRTRIEDDYLTAAEILAAHYQKYGPSLLSDYFYEGGGKIETQVMWYWWHKHTWNRIIFDHEWPDTPENRDEVADLVELHLKRMADEKGSVINQYLDTWNGDINAYLDRISNAGLTLTPFFTPKQMTAGQIELLNEALAGTFEMVPVLGGYILTFELASGQKLSFTVYGQRKLTATEKWIIVGTPAAGFVAGVLAKVGGKWVFRQTTKRVDDLVDLAPNSEVYSLALGLSRHPNHTRSGLLLRFADKVDDTNVRHYWQLIDEMGLPNAAVGRQLEGQLLDFMKNSKHIHLNLDGMLDTLDAAKLKEILKLGEQGTRVPQNITRWEFLQAWSKFRDKATFYFDGKAVDLADLLK